MSRPTYPEQLFTSNPLLAWTTEQLEAEVARRKEAAEQTNEGSRQAASFWQNQIQANNA